jgi:hypothetical protein
MVPALLAALVLVHGAVLRGPTKPVCEMATPCSEPAAGVVLVFVRGRTTTRVRTDARGRYAVRLRPGAYRVRFPRIQPATLVVRRALRADFLIDTGIR